MKAFTRADYPSLLGVTEICQASDRDLWRQLVTPITKGLLGPVVERREPRVMETVEGLFPGDEVSNLNCHRLYTCQDGIQEEFVRFPYVHNFYRTRNGAFIVKRDFMKVEVFCWFGDVEKGRGELIFKAALRDRRFDGTMRANDSALLDWRYDHPEWHKLLSSDLKSVELSVYAFMPGSRIVDITGDTEYESFVSQPFAFMDRPELFLKYFEIAWKSKRAPGQFAVPIPDVSRSTLENLAAIAGKHGYDLLELAPSHYHVTRWAMSHGYRFVDASHNQMMEAFSEGMESTRKAGTPLTRSQQSWLCVIQSLKPTELIPEHLRLNGPMWPQDNISDYCLWMYKTLSKKAEGFEPHQD